MKNTKKQYFITATIVALCIVFIFIISYACLKDGSNNESTETAETIISDVTNEETDEPTDPLPESEIVMSDTVSNEDSETNLVSEESTADTATITTYPPETTETIPQLDTVSTTPVTTTPPETTQVVTTEPPATDTSVPETSSSYYYTDQDINNLAKLLYAECRGLPSETEIACVAWVVCNRADNRGLSITQVITQRGQFAFSYSLPIQTRYYNIAYDVLWRWAAEKNGSGDVGRVLPKEYMYFHGDGKHNYFKTSHRGGLYWDYSLPSPYTT